MSDDYLLAVRLHEELNGETQIGHNHRDSRSQPKEFITAREVQYRERKDPDREVDLNSTQNIVHPEWEIVDPTPDVHAMFQAFDAKFFTNKLTCVTLEWSKRMYSCAGICYSRRNAFGKSCTIRLSEPLLKLRPRKDLVETLLHEMIHAYLFVLGIREGNGGHGPNFKKTMENINRVAGTNITVYHNFYDEVNYFKKHVWRCNGICQHRKPFFGYVKRTSNRAPGPNDIWWIQHQQSCGGYFQKIDGPSAEDKKETKPKRQSKKDIRPSTSNVITKYFSPTKISPIVSNNNNSIKSEEVVNNVRSVWAKKYPTTTNHKNETTVDLTNIPNQSVISPIIKKLKTDDGSWDKVLNEDDDDILIHNTKVEVIVLDSDDEDTGESKEIPKIDKDVPEVVLPAKQTSSERQHEIKSDILEDFLNDEDGDNIFLIDDEFDDSISTNDNEENSNDTSVIDNLHSQDELIRDFEETNGKASNKPSTSKGLLGDEIVSCPLCNASVLRRLLSEHLDGCIGLVVNIEVLPKHKNKWQTNVFKSNPTEPEMSHRSTAEVLSDAGYSEAEIRQALQNVAGSSSTTPNRTVQRDPDGRVNCPVCNCLVQASKINLHLDSCLC